MNTFFFSDAMNAFFSRDLTPYDLDIAMYVVMGTILLFLADIFLMGFHPSRKVRTWARMWFFIRAEAWLLNLLLCFGVTCLASAFDLNKTAFALNFYALGVIIQHYWVFPLPWQKADKTRQGE